MKITIPVLLTLALLSPIAASASTILTCKHEGGTSMSVETSGIMVKSSILKRELDDKEDMSLVFVVQDDKATMKGNAGQSELIKIGVNAYVERTGVGNIVLWTLLKDDNSNFFYLFQHKAYSIFGVSTNTQAFVCEQ